MNRDIEKARNNRHIVTIEDLVPKDHFLRKLNDVVNFSFIYDEAREYLSDKGQFGIDPVFIVKYKLIGFLYDINPETRIEEEIQLNMAYRWFLGIDLDEAVPRHNSVIHAWEKLSNGDVGETILKRVLRQCAEHGLPVKQGGAWDYIE